MTIGPKWKKPANGRRLQPDDGQLVREGWLQRKRGVRERKKKAVESTIGKICPKWQGPADGSRLQPEDSQYTRELRRKEKEERKKKALERFFTKVVIIGVALSSSLTFACFHESGGEVVSKFCNFILGHGEQSSHSKSSSSSDRGQDTSSKSSPFNGIFPWA